MTYAPGTPANAAEAAAGGAGAGEAGALAMPAEPPTGWGERRGGAGQGARRPGASLYAFTCVVINRSSLSRANGQLERLFCFSSPMLRSDGAGCAANHPMIDTGGLSGRPPLRVGLSHGAEDPAKPPHA